MRIHCKECDYWDPDPMTGKKFGLCRYEAPRFTSSNTCSGWYSTKAEDWCGQAYSSDIVDAEERAYTAVRKAGYNAAIQDVVAMLTAKVKKALVVQVPDPENKAGDES